MHIFSHDDFITKHFYNDKEPNRYSVLKTSGVVSVDTNTRKLYSDFFMSISERGFIREHEIITNF